MRLRHPRNNKRSDWLRQIGRVATTSNWKEEPDDLLVLAFMMYVEDAFGVEIPGDHVAKIATPGQLKDYLRARLPVSSDGPCLSQRSFYRLRSAIVEVLSVPRQVIRPETLWREILPRWRRGKLWQSIGRGVGTELPPLTRGLWTTVFLVSAVTVALLVVSGWARGASLLPDSLMGVMVLLAGGLSVLAGTFGITLPLQLYVPRRFGTVGATAAYLAATEARVFMGRNERWSLRQISLIVDRLIREVLEVREFSEDSVVFR